LVLQVGTEGPVALKIVVSAAWPVNLIEVEIVGPQAAQARFQGLAHRGGIWRAPATDKGAATAHNFASQHPLVTVLVGREPVADVCSSLPACLEAAGDGVKFGCVHEGYAGVARHSDLGVALGFSILATPGHGPQADVGDLDVRAAESVEFHDLI